jgi:ribosome biogenesis GTPase / thiamine phosphate phosphatase
MHLEAIGFSPFFQAFFEQPEAAGLVPARVTQAHLKRARVLGVEGEFDAHVPHGRSSEAATAVVAGDWVAVDPASRAVVHVLPRRTEFARQAAGRRVERQVVAANVDVVFLLAGLDGDFSRRRLERYLALAHASGARPVILLTKAAGCDDVGARRREAESVARGAPVHAIDTVDGVDPDAPLRYLGAGVTGALVGSSGVGKSTLANHLLGGARAETGPVREHDRRGQHTTSRRELFFLPSGGALLDTPGMREVQLWCEPEAVDAAFAEVADLASECRFRDCRHEGEPGCALREAVRRGQLEPERLANFGALHGEVEAHAGRREERARHEKAVGRQREKALRGTLRRKYGPGG